MKLELRENVTFSKPGTDGVLLGEDVKKAGLDPSVYAAVIPGECGTAGILNINGRIYKVEEAVREHERLCNESSTVPSFGERGHPQTAESWDVVTRFLGGRTEIQENGAAKFYGRFGVLNTSLGRDLLTVWKAGLPVGVSLRARGYLEEKVLDESSPYLSLNPGKKGQRFKEVSEVEFKAYDFVRVSSADTYLAAPTNESVNEAFRRIVEAVQSTEENLMSIKTFSELEKAHPEGAKAIRDELQAAFKAEAAIKLTEAVQAKDAELDRAKKELSEVKAANAGLTESVNELVAWKRASEKELAQAKLKAEVSESMDTFIKGRRAGAVLKNLVMEEVAEGRIASVADATKRAEKLAALVESGAAAAPAGVGGPSGADGREASDGGAKSAETPVTNAASKLKALD